ncbi:MAG: type II secretion system protein [Patescibacteria group bacterium]
MTKHEKRKGFTLIESVIYIGLFSLITGFVLIVFYQIVGSRNQQRGKTEVDLEANFIMQKISWALVGAQSINEPAVGSSSSNLSLSRFGYALNPVVFDLDSGKARIKKAGGEAATLNNDHVSVSSILFEHLPSFQAAPEGVRITLSLVSTDAERPIKASTTLQNTIYLRK